MEGQVVRMALSWEKARGARGGERFGLFKFGFSLFLTHNHTITNAHTHLFHISVTAPRASRNILQRLPVTFRERLPLLEGVVLVDTGYNLVLGGGGSDGEGASCVHVGDHYGDWWWWGAVEGRG